MKVEFLVENLENLLPVINKFIPTNSQIPILSNLLLEAGKEGFFIYATNLETGIKIKIPAKIEKEGSITVPGKQLIEIISSFPKDKVSVELTDKGLNLRCRDSQVTLQTIPRDEFPNIYDDKGEELHIFQNEELKDIFSKIVFSASIDESRPELTGILFSQKKEGLDVVATDGFRLSIKKLRGKKILEEIGSLILPAKLISEAISLKSDKVVMYVYKKANQVILEAENIILVGRLINGDFPNYERVIPGSSTTEISVDREEFIQKIRLSSIFARESANIVKAEVKEGKIKLSASSSGLGEGEASIEGKQTGGACEIAFNVKFLNDFLKSATEKVIVMSLTNGVEPALFKTEGDPDYIHIIMPVRVQE